MNVPDSDANPAIGFSISSGNCTVRGLIINRFLYSGIQIRGGTGNNVLEGNFIGTDATGTAALGNQYGVFITLAKNNLIGGTTPAARNLISGNSTGIELNGTGATSNAVRGNYIGTDVTGNVALANGVGISVNNTLGNTIGGTAAGAGNLVSGNTGIGISIFTIATGNVVQGNLIGTNAGGQALQ
jgi:titin